MDNYCRDWKYGHLLQRLEIWTIIVETGNMDNYTVGAYLEIISVDRIVVRRGILKSYILLPRG